MACLNSRIMNFFGGNKLACFYRYGTFQLYVGYWCARVPFRVAVCSISNFLLPKRTAKLLPAVFLYHVSLLWHSSGINLAEYRHQIPNHHHQSQAAFSSKCVTVRQSTVCHKFQQMWCMTNVHDQDYKLQTV